MTYDLDEWLYEKIKEQDLLFKGKWDLEKKKCPRDFIKQMVFEGMINSPKQAWATLGKWADKRIYEYGVTLDLGWLIEPIKEFWQIRDR